jgi:glycosyltransferase involved in cell wall biosynthesis
MRILHVIPILDPSHGGPPRVAARLAAGQANLGHQVTIVSYALKEPELFRQMTQRLPAFDRVQHVQLDRAGLGEWLWARSSRPRLRQLIAAADVVHIHNVWESLNRVAAAEACRAGKPYLLQPNDMLNPYALSQKKVKKKLAMALGYRAMIEHAHALLFGHAEERRLASESEFKTDHLVTALGGVFAQEVEPLPQPGLFHQHCPAVKDRPFILFLSRLHHKKGLDYLAEGFARCAGQAPQVHLVVVGHDEGARADFQKRIERHGLTDRVHLVGPMHGEAKWQAYRDAVCLCLPSRDEAYTVAITEALAAGLPAVISTNCHYDDVREYEAGIIVDLDAQAIGNALLRLVQDPDLRRRMSENARRLFRERLCFDVAARESLAIYEQCLRRPHRLSNDIAKAGT